MSAPRDPGNQTVRPGLEGYYPAGFEQLQTAWDAIHIPALPAAFTLNAQERGSEQCNQRYRRRTIQTLSIASAKQTDHIAFIDKALPHSQYELMAGEVGECPRATVTDIGERALQALLSACERFAAFVSQPDTIARYQLQGGLAHCALNCDPHTLDRESCQAIKHFHLHFIYWTGAELQPLRQAGTPLFQTRSSNQRLRILDPLLSLGSQLLHQRLQQQTLQHPQAELLPLPSPSTPPTLPGCLIRLPGWQALTHAGMAALLRQIHQTIVDTGNELQLAFTDHSGPPAPWHRHPLLPADTITSRLAALGYSTDATAQLTRLAHSLRTLSPATIERLRQRPARRIRHLSLIPPAYAINLHAPQPNSIETPLHDSDAVTLIIQPKLFAAVGGAGSVPLAGIPSVHINRGQGHYSEQAWQQRNAFQREFLQFCQPQLAGFSDTSLPAVQQIDDFERGWH